MERTHRPPRGARNVVGDLVSILVVMERTHRLPNTFARSLFRTYGFNPCCDGTDSSTARTPIAHGAPPCFNPCCDGTDSSTARRRSRSRGGPGVSILVVMERTHRHCRPGRLTLGVPRDADVSILVVMERTHRSDADRAEGIEPRKAVFQSLL